MTDNEIEDLRRATTLTGHDVYWMPDEVTARKVSRVGEPPKEEVPEPTDVAYLDNNLFVSLDSSELNDFALVTRL